MSIAGVGSQAFPDQASYLPESELFWESPRAGGLELSTDCSTETEAVDGFDTNDPTPMTNAADGIDTNILTSGIALVGSLAGTAAATTVGGLISGLAAGLVAVIKGIEALGEDHKQNGTPNPDPMKMDRPIDKK